MRCCCLNPCDFTGSFWHQNIAAAVGLSFFLFIIYVETPGLNKDIRLHKAAHGKIGLVHKLFCYHSMYVCGGANDDNRLRISSILKLGSQPRHSFPTYMYRVCAPFWKKRGRNPCLRSSIIYYCGSIAF